MPTRRDLALVGGAAATLSALAIAGVPAQEPRPWNMTPEALAAIRFKPSTDRFGPAVIEYARAALRAQIGERGRDNAGAWVDFFTQTAPDVTPAWCAGFASVTWKLASWATGKALPFETVDGTAGAYRPVLWVPELINRARRASVFVVGPPIVLVGPGSMLFTRDGNHVGLVDRFEGRDVLTIEGNVSNPRGGLDIVRELRRPAASCDYAQAPQ